MTCCPVAATDPVDRVTDGEDVVGEGALEPAGLVVGMAEVDDPGVDAPLVQRGHRGRARRHVPDLGGEHQRRDQQHRRRAVGYVVGVVVPQPVVGLLGVDRVRRGSSSVSRPPKRTTSAALRAVAVTRRRTHAGRRPSARRDGPGAAASARPTGASSTLRVRSSPRVLSAAAPPLQARVRRLEGQACGGRATSSAGTSAGRARWVDDDDARVGAAVHLAPGGRARRRTRRARRRAGSGPDLPHQRHRWPAERSELGGRDRREVRAPTAPPRRATSCAPRAATIAPLSVHRPGRGTRRRNPAASQRCWASARNREFAATPPPIRTCPTPCSRGRRGRP